MSVVVGLNQETMDMDQDFIQGIEALRKGELDLALEYFHLAEQQTTDGDFNQGLYRSYLGLVLVLQGDVSGVELCRNGAYFDNTNADIYYNLALAERKLGNRKRTVESIRAGLKIEPSHKRLLKLRQEIGQRRKLPIQFLDRDHPINRWLGRRSYKI